MKQKIVLLKTIRPNPALGLDKGTVHEAETHGNRATIKLGRRGKVIATHGQWRPATAEDIAGEDVPTTNIGVPDGGARNARWPQEIAEARTKQVLEDIGREIGVEVDKRKKMDDIREVLYQHLGQA